MSDRDIILGIVTAVNTTSTLEADARLDWLDPTPPASSVQQLPGAKWATQYVSGGGVRSTPFAVFVRTEQGDTATRADAASSLLELGTALEALSAGYTAQDTPSLVAREEGGSEVWRASFVLESTQSA